MANYGGLLTDKLKEDLDKYRAKSQMSLATAIRHLLWTHPELLKLAAALDKPAPVQKPEPPLKPGWRPVTAQPRPELPDEEDTIAASRVIMDDLRNGRIDAGSALAKLEALAARGISHRNVISGVLHVARTWESDRRTESS